MRHPAWYLFAAVLLLPVLSTGAFGQIECTGSANPGDPLFVLVRAPAAVESLEISLADDSGGVICALPGFQIDSPAASTLDVAPRDTPAGSIYAALLGIPSRAVPGTYLVRARGRGGDTAFGFSHELVLRNKRFAFEIIPLDQRLMDILRRPDPRKTREARELRELLSVYRPESVFHVEPFILPVERDFRTAGFGDRREYAFPNGHASHSVHNGLDFGLVTGTPVYACARGRVVFARDRITTGGTVVIEHLPGVYSLYFHLSVFRVEEGEIVEQGRRIADVGSTGLSTAAHLHWEIRAGGVAVDPDAFRTTETLDMGRLSDVVLPSDGTPRKGGDTP